MTSLTDLTSTLPDTSRPDWMPKPPKERAVSTRFTRAHIDRPKATVYIDPVPGGQVLRVEQSRPGGGDESVAVFFTTDDVNVQLDLASALEVIAEQLRDRASASFATFLAEVRREEQLHAAAEEANDASGFDSGYELTA